MSLFPPFYMTLIVALEAPMLNPFPGKRSIVVIDNCAIHHDEDIRRIIVEACGAYKLHVNLTTHKTKYTRRKAHLSPAILTRLESHRRGILYNQSVAKTT